MAICVATRRRCGFRIFGMPRRDFFQRLLDQLVDEIVGLDAQPLAAGDFDVGLLLVLFGQLDPHLDAGARRERDHLVGESARWPRPVFEAERAQPGDHHVLQIRLARIDDVVDARAAAERRRARLRLRCRRPHLVPVRIRVPLAIVEILAQQAEFPKLIGDVLADVGHGAVRAHDDLAVFSPSSELLKADAGITQQPLFLPSVSK